MALPLIRYNPGSGDQDLQFVRGPVDFRCFYQGRVHDNLATSGVRERVTEALDMLISFSMPAMLLADTDDFLAWGTFMAWALKGGTFQFSPDSALEDYYNCVLEDDKWEPARAGPGRYAAAVRLRILPDAQMPASPVVVMQRFYGVAGA